MESPILVVPRAPNNPQVLIAHLGEIVVNNTGSRRPPTSYVLHDMSRCSPSSDLGDDLITLTLTNMNLYSLDLSQRNKAEELCSPSLNRLTHAFGIPIL